MTQEKMSRMVTGIVVAMTLFLVILGGWLVYLGIYKGALDRRLEAAKAEAAELAAREAELKEDLADLGDPSWKLDLALKYGILESDNKGNE